MIQQVIIKNTYRYTNTYMGAITTDKKDVMKLKASGEDYTGKFGRGEKM